MDIVIVGLGKVGYRLATSLSNENNNITAVDTDENVLKVAGDNLDIMCLKGNAVSVSTLIEAGVKNCDVLISVTESDEINMICCLMGKKLGAKYTIARIRELYYKDEMPLLIEELGLDMVINPEEATAHDIALKLMYEPASFVESFSEKGADLVEILIDTKSIIAGKEVSEIGELAPNILIVSVIRGRNVLIPKGDFVLKTGDFIYVLGSKEDICQFVKKTSRYEGKKIKTAMIIGGGKITNYLCDFLNNTDIRVKIIESNYDIASSIAQKVDKGIVIHGDGTSEDLLLSEELENMDAFISLTGYDENNLMASLFAKEYGVDKIITKVSRLNYTHIIRRLGLVSIVNPMLITSGRILKFIRMLTPHDEASITNLHKIIDDNAEIIEYRIGEGFDFVNIPLKSLKIDPHVLVAVIKRKDKIIIPKGEDYIAEGDSIIVFSSAPVDADLSSVFIKRRNEFL
ncbi:MAG: Trk system potassium transporter TrkA [Lachnospiraceae bacterium]|nr:Trk system potassium transporter TrkA [Lachnospiraceae bacterium]